MAVYPNWEFVMWYNLHKKAKASKTNMIYSTKPSASGKENYMKLTHRQSFICGKKCRSGQ